MLALYIDKEQAKLCTGCRACEVACSFHFTNCFSPAHSAIRVSRDFSTGEIRVAFQPTCDLCQGEEEPLCMVFCAPGAINKELLKDIETRHHTNEHLGEVP